VSKASDGPNIALFVFALSAFVLDLVAFIVGLNSYPYSSGCNTSAYSGCTTLKAAIGLDGALWHVLIIRRLMATGF